MIVIKDQIADLIKKAVEEIGLGEREIPAFTLEHPDVIEYGDYATNVALVLSKTLKKSPLEVAHEIVRSLEKNKTEIIQRVEIAGPGFINFYLSSEYFLNAINSVLESRDNYGKNENLKGQKTVVEYTDPNPFKDFHIGHLMSNTIGEAISRLIEANGAKVIRACYSGDVGLHVAKTVWGVQKMIADNPESEREFFGNLFGFGKNQRVWGRAYALGATKYEEDETVKKEIIILNKKIYERSDKELNKIYDVGRKVSLKEFEKIYKILGTNFDKYFFESKMAGPGKILVEEGFEKGIFEKSDGAFIFSGEKYGLHTRVFINSEGLPTYEAKELALAKIKFDQTGYEKSIVVTGNEINDYYKVVMKALSFIYPDLEKKVTHIGHGMLRLSTGKMSSRTGKVITGESLLAEIKKRVLEKMQEHEISELKKIKIAEIISVGALKYPILKQNAGSDIIFDFDKSLSFEGDSGPYLQYSYVRAISVLKKAKAEGLQTSLSHSFTPGRLVKLLVRFPEIVERAGKEFSPHYLVSYLTEIASEFNHYYANNKIIDKNDLSSCERLALVEAFSQIMKNGLNLLGIKVPTQM